MNLGALEALLAGREWVAADAETRRLLLADADEGGFVGLESAEVLALDCGLLCAIDAAWRTATNEDMGFHAQAEVLAAVRGEGLGPKQTWREFGSRVGWVRQGEWVEEEGLIAQDDAPKGHHPWVPGVLPTVSTGRTYEVLFLFYKVFDDCRSPARD